MNYEKTFPPFVCFVSFVVDSKDLPARQRRLAPGNQKNSGYHEKTFPPFVRFVSFVVDPDANQRP